MANPPKLLQPSGLTSPSLQDELEAVTPDNKSLFLLAQFPLTRPSLQDRRSDASYPALFATGGSFGNNPDADADTRANSQGAVRTTVFDLSSGCLYNPDRFSSSAVAIGSSWLAGRLFDYNRVDFLHGDSDERTAYNGHIDACDSWLLSLRNHKSLSSNLKNNAS